MLNLRAAVAFLCLAATLLAQSQTATIRGALTDRTGGVVPGALVSLSGGGVEKSATTQIDGSYSITPDSVPAVTRSRSYSRASRPSSAPSPSPEAPLCKCRFSSWSRPTRRK